MTQIPVLKIVKVCSLVKYHSFIGIVDVLTALYSLVSASTSKSVVEDKQLNLLPRTSCQDYLRIYETDLLL